MGDIKLFRLDSATVHELEGQSFGLEKHLQTVIEENLPKFLGIQFLATEYVTGRTHGGRIDTLGLDENSCPVIIEYKRDTKDTVINQGLFYLDWLLDHKAEFELLVLNKLGQEAYGSIEWSSPRLICIAGEFTKYDEHMIQQINRNIELIRYKKFGENLLLFDLVNARTAEPAELSGHAANHGVEKSIEDTLELAHPALKARFEVLRSFVFGLGDDVQLKSLKMYYAFKRIRNFACVEFRTQQNNILMYLKVDPTTVDLASGFTRDVTNIGHFGTGELEVTIRNDEDLERAKQYIVLSYEAS